MRRTGRLFQRRGRHNKSKEAATRTIVCFIAIGLLGTIAVAQEQVYSPGDGVTTPVPIDQPRPEYTPDALTARVEGIVTLECVVRTDGTVGERRVVKPLFPTLDAEALRYLAAWKFKPGTKDGKPVAVRVIVEMSFSLSDSPDVRGPRLGSPDVVKVTKGVSAPRLVREVEPQYTAQAYRVGAQGTIWMSCVVLQDGTVGDVRVNKGVHPDLDREAVRALRKWQFAPAMKDGVAVPVEVAVEMTMNAPGQPRPPK